MRRRHSAPIKFPLVTIKPALGALPRAVATTLWLACLGAPLALMAASPETVAAPTPGASNESALSAAQAATETPNVTVSFIKPESFVDVIDSRNDREPALRVLSRHLQELGRGRLLPGQALHIQVLDVDLAGHIDYRTQPYWIRVVGPNIDWPRITLRYELIESGAITQHGEAQLSDLDYANRPGRLHDTSALPSERRMLTAWFVNTFGPQQR
jgi:hypothetical protein